MLSMVAWLRPDSIKPDYFSKSFRKRRNCSYRKGRATILDGKDTLTKRSLLFSGLDSIEPELLIAANFLARILALPYNTSR